MLTAAVYDESDERNCESTERVRWNEMGWNIDVGRSLEPQDLARLTVAYSEIYGRVSHGFPRAARPWMVKSVGGREF